MKRIISVTLPVLLPAVLVLLGLSGVGAQTVRRSPELPRFMGREVTITEPEASADGFFPKGPASVCVEGPPQRQCYTAPEGFGRRPTVELVQVEKDKPALLFSAETPGTSGWQVHFALLRPGSEKNLQNLFMSDPSVSNQSQHAFWNESAVSEVPVFVTADFVWGPSESHYVEHRYIISAYVWRHESLTDNFAYYLEDRYMTVRKYDLDANANVLNSEKPEILARLKRVKAETERQQRAPR